MSLKGDSRCSQLNSNDSDYEANKQFADSINAFMKWWAEWTCPSSDCRVARSYSYNNFLSNALANWPLYRIYHNFYTIFVLFFYLLNSPCYALYIISIFNVLNLYYHDTIIYYVIVYIHDFCCHIFFNIIVDVHDYLNNIIFHILVYYLYYLSYIIRMFYQVFFCLYTYQFLLWIWLLLTITTLLTFHYRLLTLYSYNYRALLFALILFYYILIYDHTFFFPRTVL